ncbi:MAG: sulfite exporter TauE/SafE family protein [bacterium]|nr:sulfite exporter TauE/SafE family protein [bacterium]
MLILIFGIGFGVGTLLGLLGGGGAIITVPALVYLVGQSPQVAVTTSLAIVGANSAMGAFLHNAHGALNWRVALVFGGSGMVMSYLSAGVSKQFSPILLMMAFAVLMLLIGALMVFYRPKEGMTDQPISLIKVVISGALVGLLTGFLGVGGGFLIVPALVILVGLPMKQAIGTSLVIIAMNSTSGFLGHLSGQAIDTTLIVTFVLAGMGGTFVGVRIGRMVSPTLLRKGFAGFVIILAVFLLIDNMSKLV